MNGSMVLPRKTKLDLINDPTIWLLGIYMTETKLKYAINIQNILGIQMIQSNKTDKQLEMDNRSI